MSQLVRIVSGGQIGVDQTALRAAIECGLQCGGWCPPDYQSEDGAIPAEYRLQPTPHGTSLLAPGVERSQRTEWNVCCSDATLIFRLMEATKDGEDPGTRWTEEFANLIKRPLHSYDPRKATVSEIIEWLAEAGKERPVRWLKIAGPSNDGLKEKVGRRERDHFLEATRALIISDVRELASAPSAAC